MFLLIGGLSGAGKSTLGQFLQNNCAFRWIELDSPEEVGDPVDNLGIRRQWDAFLGGNPTALIGVYAGNTMLSVASFPIIKAPLYLDTELVRVRYLWGAREKCFERAHRRQLKPVTREHWDGNNAALLEYLDSGECPSEWKIDVFDESGLSRTVKDLARAVVE